MELEKIIMATICLNPDLFEMASNLGFRTWMLSEDERRTFEIISNKQLNLNYREKSLGFSLKDFVVDSNTLQKVVRDFIYECRAAWEDVKAKEVLSSNDKVKLLSDIAQERQSLWVYQDGNPYDNTRDIVDAAIEGKPLPGLISWGDPRMDGNAGQLMKADFAVIGARPGMGKTTFTSHLISDWLKKGIKVGYNCIDMSSEKAIAMLACGMIGKTSKDLFDLHLTKDELFAVRGHIDYLEGNDNFIIYDERDSANLFAKLRQTRPEICVIDYLQLMDEGEKTESVTKLSKNSKGIAKELGIRVLALSQLSRDVEKRGGAKRPNLSDLRQSGAIEQDADMVGFLYRPAYYGFDTDVEGDPINPYTLEIMIAKSRGGIAGTTIMASLTDGVFSWQDPTEDDFDSFSEVNTNRDITEPVATSITIRTNDDDIGDVPF